MAIRECVLPHVQGSTIISEPDNLKREKEAPAVHVVLTSHGNCISELVSALLRLDPKADQDGLYFGLMNTAWTRVEIRVRVRLFLGRGHGIGQIAFFVYRMDTMVLSILLIPRHLKCM